ncbi:MAG: lytic transglycosylase domain-containing protein [Thermodesulfobacteriota bacterium]
MYFSQNKKMLVSAAVLFGALVLADAVLLPAFEPYSFEGTSRLDYISGILNESKTGLSDDDEAKLARVILNESSSYKVDPLLVMALIKTESTFYNWARSYKGAKGLMQIMPMTGRWVAGELDLEWEGDHTLFDPYANVKMGIHYLSVLREKYGEDTFLTLAAYNAGPSRLSRIIRDGGSLPRTYASKVLANYKDFQKKAGYTGYN